VAELTKLESKLAEVIGLAMAAQGATEKLESLVSDRQLASRLKSMRREAADAEKRGTAVASGITGKKGAILKEARTTKKKATEMMSDYLERGSDGLDGFEFLTMAEAGEVGHWEILGKLNEKAGESEVGELVEWALPIQERHLKDVREGSLSLAAEEDPNA
jgi:hypothetical protein